MSLLQRNTCPQLLPEEQRANIKDGKEYKNLQDIVPWHDGPEGKEVRDCELGVRRLAGPKIGKERWTQQRICSLASSIDLLADVERYCHSCPQQTVVCVVVDGGCTAADLAT